MYLYLFLRELKEAQEALEHMVPQERQGDLVLMDLLVRMEVMEPLVSQVFKEMQEKR